MDDKKKKWTGHKILSLENKNFDTFRLKGFCVHYHSEV